MHKLKKIDNITKYLIIALLIIICSCQKTEEVLTVDFKFCNSYPETSCDETRGITAPDNFRLDTIGLINEASANPYSSIKEFQFLNDLIGFAISNPGNGFSSEFFKTVDGGITWELVNLDNNYEKFVDLHFMDEQIGIISLFETNTYLRTSDGGVSWTELSLDNIVGNIDNLCDSISSPFVSEEGTIISIVLDESDALWACYTYRCQSFILKSLDDGISWEKIYAYEKAMKGMKIKFDNIYLFRFDEILKISSNGDLLELIEADFLSDIKLINENEWLVQMSFSGAEYTADGGQTWTRLTDNTIKLLDFQSPNSNLYAEMIGYCPDGDYNTENSLITYTENNRETCLHSQPSYYHVFYFQWSQKMGEGKWYMSFDNYLVELSKE